MSSAIFFNLGKSKILSSGNGLTPVQMNENSVLLCFRLVRGKHTIMMQFFSIWASLKFCRLVMG